MKDTPDKQKKRRGFSLLLSIIVIFGIFGMIVFAVPRRTTKEMSEAAIQNLSESLDLIQSSISAPMRKTRRCQSCR